jgi:eukaryotic-like serine/threonine-protein kinase
MVLAVSDCYLAGRYRLCQWLAAGGMGQVWQAVDEVLGRPVAVKLLRDEYAQDPSFVGRFRAEARYAAAVAHPGIASVFDYGEVRTAEGAEPTPFLVMELVAGEPLSALLAREGRLRVDRSLEIVGQAAVAVGAAHRAGLVHRDIKPANLLVCPDGTVQGDRLWRRPGARPGRRGGVAGGHGGLPVARAGQRPSGDPSQ